MLVDFHTPRLWRLAQQLRASSKPSKFDTSQSDFGYCVWTTGFAGLWEACRRQEVRHWCIVHLIRFVKTHGGASPALSEPPSASPTFQLELTNAASNLGCFNDLVRSLAIFAVMSRFVVYCAGGTLNTSVAALQRAFVAQPNAVMKC